MFDKNETQTLSVITPEALAALGGGQIVYIKSVVIEGRPAVAIHSADGSPLALADNRNQAFAAAIQHEMQPLSVH